MNRKEKATILKAIMVFTHRMELAESKNRDYAAKCWKEDIKVLNRIYHKGIWDD